MMLQPFAKLLVDTGMLDDVPQPEFKLPFVDTVTRTCAAVKGKFDRSVPHLKNSAMMAGASCLLTSAGAFTIGRGVGASAEGALYALGIGMFLAAGSAHCFWQAIKA